MGNLNHRRLRFGPFEANLRTRELWRHGIRIKLGGQPYQILISLLEKPGELVTRDELRRIVWADDTFVDFSHGLNAAVNKLREALCDSPEAPRYIETLPRRGYRFIGKVEEVPATTEAPATVSAAPLPLLTDPPPAPTLIPDRYSAMRSFFSDSQRMIRLPAVAAPIFLLALAAVAIVFLRSTSRPSAEEIERFQKQGAEIAAKRFHEKQHDEVRGAGPLVTYAAKNALADAAREEDTARRREESLTPLKDSAPTTAANSFPSEESFLLRLSRKGKTLEILPETSNDQRPSILRVDLRQSSVPHSAMRVLGGWEAIGGPQPSPDGKKLVFMAGRMDSLEIWVCNIDGSSPKMLTNLKSAGTPRWSPDGRWIAFDSDGRYGHSAIFLVSADGGPVRTVVQNDANNSVPSWSHDGKYIYFASNLGSPWENHEVWKIPFIGGAAVQITHHGGFSAFESFDGQTLYYAKSRYQNPEIWRVPVNGGNESRVALLHPSTWASWAVTKAGILLLSEYESSASQLEYFDFASRSIHSLAALEKASFWLAASADGSSVWYSELTDSQARRSSPRA